jgi:hypothetical protein
LACTSVACGDRFSVGGREMWRDDPDDLADDSVEVLDSVEDLEDDFILDLAMGFASDLEKVLEAGFALAETSSSS